MVFKTTRPDGTSKEVGSDMKWAQRLFPGKSTLRSEVDDGVLAGSVS